MDILATARQVFIGYRINHVPKVDLVVHVYHCMYIDKYVIDQRVKSPDLLWSCFRQSRRSDGILSGCKSHHSCGTCRYVSEINVDYLETSDRNNKEKHPPRIIDYN